MAKNRGSSRKLGLFRRVYSPLNHLVSAARNVSRSAIRQSGRVVNSVGAFAQNSGRAVMSHANGAVRNLLSRRNRKTRRNTRKNRK
jgi:hypothetical protein